MRTLLALLLCLSLPACADQQIELLYSGNMDGEIEPCGCSIGADFGGIQRRATLIDQMREANPELMLISAGGLFSPEMGSDRIKHDFILTGMAQLDYDAIGVQWSDLAHGAQLLADSQLPFAAGNWKGAEIAPQRQANSTLFFTQWLDPQTSPYKAMQAVSPIHEQPETLQQQLDQADSEGKLTVLATTLELEAVQQLFDLSVVDILIIKAAYEFYGEPQQLDSTLVLQPGSRGQRIGHLKLQLDPKGQISDWQHAVIDLPDGMQAAPRLDQWYSNYNDALRQDYLERVAQRKALKRGESPYLGEQQCKTCHASQHQIWSQTAHANAFAQLEEVGKEFDSHCIGCHTVGFLEPGGYLDLGLTGHLTNVQCESCHGSGREHASNAGQIATPNKELTTEQICSQCHIREHSPAFSVESYWPRIAHPGKPVLESLQQSQ